MGVFGPSWRRINDIQKNLDLSKIPREPLRPKSEQYLERPEGLRAEAREPVSQSGDDLLDKVLRGGAIRVRSVSRVVKEREREVREQPRGPAKAGATAAGSSHPVP